MSESLREYPANPLIRRLKNKMPKSVLRGMRSIISSPSRVKPFLYKTFVANRRLKSIRRIEVKNCWCGGELTNFKYHSGYGICNLCGSYANIRPPAPEELSKLYSLDL